MTGSEATKVTIPPTIELQVLNPCVKEADHPKPWNACSPKGVDYHQVYQMSMKEKKGIANEHVITRLAVSTHLKNISQNGNLPQVHEKIFETTV